MITGATTHSKRNQKCFVCDKRHYPFCKSVKKGVCNVCKKKHQPFCRRKVETSHPVVDTASMPKKIKGMTKREKAKFAASLVLD